MKVFCLLAVVGIACAAPERAKRQLVPSNEHCNFQAPNPCSTSKTNTQVFFPHPNDNTKFIQCNAVGEMYIIQCPHGKLYNKATVSCVSQNYIPGGQGSGQIGGSVSLTSNPCTPENLAKGIIYFAVTGEKNKFIECDLNGNANVLTCPSLLVWEENRLSCVYSFQAGQPTPTPNTASLGGSGVTTNPCKNSVVTTGNTQFHSHPDSRLKHIPVKNMADSVVENCPRTFQDWSSRASSVCSRDTYHCVEDEKSRIVEVCAVPQWINAGHCPVYNTVGKDMSSRVCSGNSCPKEVYRSDAVYKYHSCQQFGPSSRMSTSTSPLANTPMSDTSDTSTIAVAVSSVLVVILLVVLGIILWKKKKLFDFPACLVGKAQTGKETSEKDIEEEQDHLIESEQDFDTLEKITPKELDADNNLISRCQHCLEKGGQTLALIGKLGSGKRTLAAQVAIRIAKKNPALKLKIVTERDTITEDLKSRQSTILIIHDPLKTWYTDRYTENIISLLLKLCTSAKNKDNNFYIIVVFHCNDWNSLQFGKKKKTMDTMFPKRQAVSGNKISVKLIEMAKGNQGNISNTPFHREEKSLDESLKMSLFLKNRAFQQEVLKDPILFIIRALKTLEMSNKNHEQLAFNVMVIVMLHGGEITKRELLADGIHHHRLFADLKKKMDVPGSIAGCTEQLLEIFLEETGDGQSYRFLHDVITRCTFISAFENHRTLLFTECDEILVLESLRLKSFSEKLNILEGILYDISNLKIGIPSYLFEEMARLFCQRTEMTSVLQKSRLYDNRIFQDEWNKAELYKLNTRDQ